MSKKVWSIILLCLIAVSFILTVAVFVNTGISIYNLENAEIDQSKDILPLASVFGVAFVAFALLIGFVFIGGIVSSVGFLCSLINIRISQNAVINRASKVFSYIFLVCLIFIVGVSVYFTVTVL